LSTPSITSQVGLGISRNPTYSRKNVGLALAVFIRYLSKRHVNFFKFLANRACGLREYLPGCQF
jgi:hypothetical protein